MQRYAGRLLTGLLALVLAMLASTLANAAEVLPSWNEGATRTRIIEFVTAATTEGGPGYIAPADRIAVFDNDGTLWAEQPAYFQLFFAIDRIKAMAPQHPEWNDTEPFKSILAGDMAGFAKQGEHALLEVVMQTHAGMSRRRIQGDRHPVDRNCQTPQVPAPL